MIKDVEGMKEAIEQAAYGLKYGTWVAKPLSKRKVLAIIDSFNVEEPLTAELAEAKTEIGNLFDRLRIMAQEVAGRDSDIERLIKELAATHRNKCMSCDESSYDDELAKVRAELARERERAEKAEAALDWLAGHIAGQIHHLLGPCFEVEREQYIAKAYKEANREKGASDA